MCSTYYKSRSPYSCAPCCLWSNIIFQQVFISESREKQEQIGQRAHYCQKNHDHRQIFWAADGTHLYTAMNLDAHENTMKLNYIPKLHNFHPKQTHTNGPFHVHLYTYVSNMSMTLWLGRKPFVQVSLGVLCFRLHCCMDYYWPEQIQVRFESLCGIPSTWVYPCFFTSKDFIPVPLKDRSPASTLII